MKNKNILEFCLSPALGGLELFVKTSFEYFEKETPTFVCVAKDKLLDKNINSNKKFTLKRNKFFPIFPALKLAKIIDKNDIDIVHFHWTKDIATVVLAKILSKKKPKIVQSRHMRMTRFKSDFYHKWLYKNISLLHAVTKEVQKQLIRFIPQNVRPMIEMIYLGVDLPKVDSNKIQNLKQKYNLKDEFVVGIVGRIEEGKGQHIVVKAISKLKDLNIKALIVGSFMNEGYEKELKSLIKEKDIEDRVIFTGFTKDVDAHIQLCDAMVLATVEETFGLVVIEAMANKKATLAVNRGGPTEIIKDMEDGLLFKRDDEELAKKIELLYHDRELKERLAQKGYEKVKSNFNKEKQMKKLYKAISELE